MSFPREGNLSALASLPQQQQVPILVLKEGTTESKGRQAQRNNIRAAKLIAELVKSALGPRGMDKMLVNSIGDVTITNDGATILKEVDVEHPAAKMMVEVSKSIDNEVGDGTTSAVILAGAFPPMVFLKTLLINLVTTTLFTLSAEQGSSISKPFCDEIL